MWKKHNSLKSHARGCYISENIYTQLGRERKTPVLCKSFCWKTHLLGIHDRRNVIRTMFSWEKGRTDAKAIVRLCLGSFVQFMVTHSQDKRHWGKMCVCLAWWTSDSDLQIPGVRRPQNLKMSPKALFDSRTGLPHGPRTEIGALWLTLHFTAAEECIVGVIHTLGCSKLISNSPSQLLSPIVTSISRCKGIYKIEVRFSITWNGNLACCLLQERQENKIDSSGNVQITLIHRCFMLPTAWAG